MTSYTWKGVSGDWNDASNWTPSGGPPTASDDATINGRAHIIITVNTHDAAKSLTLSDQNASLNIDGASASLTLGSLLLSGGALYVSAFNDGGELAVSGTLDLKLGALTLGRGGTVSGGTIVQDGGGLYWHGGTLSGVTYEGTLNLNGHAGHVTDGLTMSGFSGPGTINVGGGSHLYFDGTQTIRNATIYLRGSTTNRAHLRETDLAGEGNQVLTLDANTTINVVGYAAIRSGSAPGDGIVNDGAINLLGFNGPPSNLIVDTNTFVNNGTIDVGDLVGGDLHSVTVKTAVTGKGTDTIHSKGILQFDAGVSTAATLGDQNIDFAGGGLLRLLGAAPTSFYGEISDFAAGDQINLAGVWAFSGISHAGDVTTLTLSNGSTTHGFEFAGDYAQSNFSFHTQLNGVTAITYA